jgi:phage baseplate assembly protein W
MIPAGGSILNAPVEEQQQPSLTWKLDLENKRITQMIDGLEAVKQAVFVILETERFQHLIYSFDFGSELQGLIGKSPLFVQSEIRRLIKEALLQDDRITDVQNITFQTQGDSMLVEFTVVSVFGNFTMTKEV